MRFHSFVTPALILSAALTPAAAQSGRIYSSPAPGFLRAGDDQPRAALGIGTSGSTSPRDTLGLLITSVAPNSPAEQAGIEEGNRIASINGVNLRIVPADVGDLDISTAMSRRLTRELSKLRPGDEAELRIYDGNRTRTVRVRTVDSDSLYSRRRLSRTQLDDRPTIGIGIGTSGSRRDTLGVLVMFVNDSGPAASAGIEEGNRIASIEDVDLRVGREDAGDDFIANSKVRRLQKEIARLHPGDEVELRVYADGRYRNVRVRVARASDLPHRRGAFMITGDGMGMMPPSMFPLGVDGAMIGSEVRRSIERAMEGAGHALEGFGRGFGRARVWQDDIEDVPHPLIEPIEPIHIEPLEPSKLRAPVLPKVPFNTTIMRTDALTPEMLSATVLRDDSEPAASSLNIAGLRMVPVGVELSAYLGKGSERGLLVVEVPKWARAALRAGDVVLSVDGRPVRSSDAADEVTFALPRFRDAQLDILRDSVRQSVTLPARR